MKVKLKPVYEPENEQGSAPAETPAETQVESQGSDGLDILDFFEGMSKEYDEAPEEVIETPTGEASGTTPEQGVGQQAQPVVQQQETPAVVQTQTAQGSNPGATPTGAQPQAQPVAGQEGATNLGAQAQATPQGQAQPVAKVAPEDAFNQLHQAIAAQKDVFTQQLAEQMYSMSEAQQQEFLENPGVALPKLAAQVHTNVVASISKMIATNIPAAVMGTLEAHKENQAREERFFSANPGLKREHMALITEVGRTYNSVNPKSTEADFIRDVGLLVTMRLGLPVQPPAGGGNNVTQPHVNMQQQRVAVQTPGQVVRQVAVPFQPGGSRAAPAQPGSQPQKTVWDQLLDFHNLEQSGGLDT